MDAAAGELREEEQISDNRYEAYIHFMMPFKDLREFEKHRYVGATSLAARFLSHSWQTNDPPTSRSVHIMTRTINLDNRSIVVSMGDGSRVCGIISVYEILADVLRTENPSTVAGVVILYDITREQTWEDCKVLIEELGHAAKELLQSYAKPPVSFRERLMIVGCKCDPVQEREVDYVTVKQYADEKGLLFFETSAKEDINVEPAFVSFVAQLLNHMK